MLGAASGPSSAMRRRRTSSRGSRGDFERTVRVASGVRSDDGRFLFRAQRAGLHRLADSRRVTAARAAGARPRRLAVRGRRRRGRSVLRERGRARSTSSPRARPTAFTEATSTSGASIARPDGKWGTPDAIAGARQLCPRRNGFRDRGRSGWLDFGSGRPGGLGRTDIWRAKPAGRRPASGSSRTPGPPSTRRRMSTSRCPPRRPDDDPHGDRRPLYESRREGDGWAPRRKLDPPVNVNGSEIGALFSPSGRSLLFARDLKGTQSGELFVWHIQGREDWPPRCPRK